MNYIVGDFAIRIKNAVMARRRKIAFPHTKVVKNLAELLVKGNYLKNVKEEAIDGKKMITAEVAYANRIPIFTDVSIISKPSLRVYVNKEELMKKQNRSIGNIIVSTNSGLMLGKEAIKKGLGGELLFAIW
jgi:small subunit ribosomal protein S8